MACPICVSPEGTAITAGMRAGAGVLILVTAVVLGFVVRFAWRLWQLESAPHPPSLKLRRTSSGAPDA
jgi:hypothetical protein